MRIPLQLPATLLRLHYSRTPFLIIHFHLLILFGFFFSFGPSLGRKSYHGILTLRSVSTTWAIRTIPSFSFPSCLSRCDDPGDGSCVAFRFRPECDGLAGDKGGPERCEVMRRAGNTVRFVFHPVALCLGLLPPSKQSARTRGSER
jgi:hypothetical protein